MNDRVISEQGGESVRRQRRAPRGRVAVPCPNCERPMWTTRSGYRPKCWRCREAEIAAVGCPEEGHDGTVHVPKRSQFVGPWYLRAPYETSDGRYIGMWCRNVRSGASWYSGVDVVYYTPPDPIEHAIDGRPTDG